MDVSQEQGEGFTLPGEGCVLFLGQTGLRKDLVREALNAEFGLGANSQGGDKQWEALDLDDYLDVQADGGGEVRDFLQQDAVRRQSRWGTAASEVANKLRTSSAAHKGVFLHGFYWYNGELFNHVMLQALAEMRPTCIVTLIDDLYDIHSRIMEREEELNTGAIDLTLANVATWRWAEIGLGDLIAKNVYPDRVIPHYVVAVKHSAKTLLRLIFDRERLPVYASFPIFKVRLTMPKISVEQRGELKSEINEFRRRLRDADFTLLDPLTIDEIRFGQDGSILDRWDVTELNSMVVAEPVLQPATVEQMKWGPIRADIETQVTRRDFRQVDATAAIACYRPKAYDGIHSSGTHAELRYAQRAGKAAFVVHQPERDGGPYLGPGPFEKEVRPNECRSVDELLRALAERQRRRSERFAAAS